MSWKVFVIEKKVLYKKCVESYGLFFDERQFLLKLTFTVLQGITYKLRNIRLILRTLANSNLLEGESFPNLCSVVEHESMKVWAMTDRHESRVAVLFISNIKSGFLIKLTQNLSGRLFDFHECTTSGSTIPCFLAASSSRSNSHLTAGGSASFTVRIVMKKSSTNFCIVPLVDSSRVKNISGIALCVLSPAFPLGNWWSSMGFTRWYIRGFVPVSMSPFVVIMGDCTLLKYMPETPRGKSDF